MEFDLADNDFLLFIFSNGFRHNTSIKNMTINYFVSFVGSGKKNVRVFGDSVIESDKELKTRQDFDEIRNHLEENNDLREVIITFYKKI